METSEQEIELFLPLLGIWSFVPSDLKLIFITENEIFQAWNKIIFPTSRPLMKKLLLQNLSHLFQVFQNEISKLKMELSKQEMELYLPPPGLW